jgi:RimJ/RimL family protein N-acetyltransferase
MTVPELSQRRVLPDQRGSAVDRTASGLKVDPQCIATAELASTDREAILDLFARSSAQTRHDRFHQSLAVMPQLYLDDILSHRQLALTARDTCREAERGRIIGLASAARLTPAVAEIAVWVADSWQRSGVGTLLTRALLDDLARAGAKTAIGIIEPGNRGVRRLIDRVAPCHSIHSSDGLLVVEIPLHGPHERTDRLAGLLGAAAPVTR